LLPKALIPSAGRKKTDSHGRKVHWRDKVARLESRKCPTKKMQTVKSVKKPDMNIAVEVE